MNRIVVLVGGSGSGKSTVAMELEKRGFHRLVTTTTRPMRKGEINHVHYHFVTEEEFWKIERVEENQYVGHWYGLSKAEVKEKLRKYHKLVIVMDINGAKAMKNEYGEMVEVVFLTITPEEMEKRLRKRGDDDVHVRERMRQAYEHQEFTPPSIADLVIHNVNMEKTIHDILTFAKKEAV